MRKTVLSVAAHGDDAEFMAGGTLAKLAAEGHDVYLAIATENDRGSFRLSGQELRALSAAPSDNSTAYEYIIICPMCKSPFTSAKAYGEHFNKEHANEQN